MKPNLPYKIILAALLAAQNFLAVAQTNNAARAGGLFDLHQIHRAAEYF